MRDDKRQERNKERFKYTGRKHVKKALTLESHHGYHGTWYNRSKGV